MRIKLLKTHLDNAAGEIIETTEKRGGYLVRIGTAIAAKELKQKYINKKIK